MASYGSRSPSPIATSSNRRMKSCARRCERACCTAATYFPLAFIYGLTTWAVWVDAGIGFHKDAKGHENPYSKKIPSAIGVVLYILLNSCYTVAVFTDPGSPTNSSPGQRRGKYSVLPTSEPHDASEVQTITVSSTGGARYCKKCHVSKPDRTHHCSTCKRCVLKMDHHCPWLATCLGLHNYKAFVLFLIYVSLFCWACFFNTAYWIYHEIFVSNHYIESFGPVNIILLAVLSGIIGLVITGFTSWHIYLSTRGQTTIECLEKTRYLSGVRKQVEANRQEQATHSRHPSESIATNLKRIGDQVLEFHANAVPGASRFEEGEERASPTLSERVPIRSSTPSSTSRLQPSHLPPPSNQPLDSPAQRALRNTYADMESNREHDRYEEYLQDQESSKMPNAFDLGWRRNLSHLFGPNPLLWWLPVCNTTGDGWRWEVSEKWVKANDDVSRQREERLRNAQAQPDGGLTDTGHLRGGGSGEPSAGAGRHYPDDRDSALSLHTIRRHQAGPKMKRDFDRSEEGEVASFQVSGSESDGDDSGSDSDDDIGQIGSRSRSQREDDGDGWGGHW